MPIIATVSRRSLSTRCLMGGIYALLIVGGVSMVYPFLLMIATSTTGEPEVAQYRLIPKYWYDRTALFQRYLQEKYQAVADLNAVQQRDAHAWRDISLPAEHQSSAEASAGLWKEFCEGLSPGDFGLWFVGRRNMPGKSEMLWREFLRRRYASVEQLSMALGRQINSFTEIFAPYDQVQGRLWPGVAGVEGEEWSRFKTSIPPEYREPVDGAAMWHAYLRQRYDSVAVLNRANGSSYASFDAVPLARRYSPGPLAKDWEQWVRTQLSYRFIQIDDGSARYKAFLISTLGSVEKADERLGTDYTHNAINWPPATPPAAELDAIDLFLRNLPATAALSVNTPDVEYQDFISKKFDGNLAAYNLATGEQASSFSGVRPPYAKLDVVDFTATAWAWRWWALTRNYGEVIDYIAIRGRSLWNTVLLCCSLVLASVTVNPLAAYALSRFRLSLTNQVLTFLLATMAFPGEITMIPNFLLLRHFPLWGWLGGFVVGALVCASLMRGGTGKLRWTLAIALSLLAAVFTSLYIVPGAGQLLGIDLGPISLLNTFPALILPRLAGGFAIFLLKGFFDSLPEELFEAGRIDGASELRMFLNLALPMSTAILAVIVLQTFTAAYGSYLWALVICQDDSMWTLMVHIFQLQQWAPSYLTMAAAVLCSIPTLFVFIAAQNVIMRGVVVPSER
jgi:ABC-type glycerol-3-phosphate transport system permease component